MTTAARKRTNARLRRPFFRPSIDALEQRAMLAADLQFTPLATSAVVSVANDTGGLTPYNLATEFNQTIIQRRTTDPDLGTQLSQNTLNESGPFVGRYLFTTSQENGTDANLNVVGTLNRTDLVTGQTINLLDIAVSDLQTGPELLGDVITMQNLSAIRWTPWGTLLVAEAVDSDVLVNTDNDPVPDPHLSLVGVDEGLVYEIFNPTSAQPTIVARPNLGSAHFEGIDIDSQGNVYYGDNREGTMNSAIFRFVSNVVVDNVTVFSPLEGGDVFVLNVDLTGEATWEPVTFVAPDVFSLRDALDDVGGPAFTAFDTVRDLEIGIADFGDDDIVALPGVNEVPDETLYVAIQGEDRVIAIDLDGPLQDYSAPFVFTFVDATVDADFNDPVDIAVDAGGRVYIGEAIDPPPAPGGDGNDVWVASDSGLDTDDATLALPVIDLVTPGSTDQFGRLASLRVSNSSVHGLYVNPFNNNQIYVNASSETAAKNAIVRFNFAGVLQPSVTEVDVGNGQIVLSIVGTAASDYITISLDNGSLVKVRIGSKTLKGFAADQQIVVYGLGGSDYIISNTKDFYSYTIFGGDGNDYIATGNADDTIAGEAGNDRITAGEGNNVLSGGAGNDSLNARNGDDILDGGDGNDNMVSNGGNDTLLGGAGNDRMTGGLDNDYLDGGAGNDFMDGYYGDDILFGGAGNDILRGGPGINVLIGGDGADALYGGQQEDLLIGDRTAADGDEAALRALAALWQMNFFSDTRAQEILDFLDGVDGLPDGDGIINDTRRDLLDGGLGLDLFFRFGTSDTIRIINSDDEVFDLS